MARDRIGVPFEDWPELDRRLFMAGCEEADPFDDPRYGSHLAAATIRGTKDSYSIWLGLLREEGWLDPAAHPVDRVTLPRMGRYFDAMLERGNSDFTVNGNFQKLQAALRIMAPDRDVGFVTKPNGVSIRSLLAMRKRSFAVIDSSVLIAWGMDLVETAGVHSSPKRRAIQVRDGVLIMLLAIERADCARSPPCVLGKNWSSRAIGSGLICRRSS